MTSANLPLADIAAEVTSAAINRREVRFRPLSDIYNPSKLSFSSLIWTSMECGVSIFKNMPET
jgi:hypothetical protein